MMKEVWKQIRGFEKYSVSNLGNVRNDVTGKMLKPRISDHGTNRHAKVSLSEDKKLKQLFVHRLVADAFIKTLTGPEELVNHINGVPTDNRVENLEICDLSRNGRHSYALRSRIAELGVVFVPWKNSSHNGLFLLIRQKNRSQYDEELVGFLQQKNFKCLTVEKHEIKRLVAEYLGA